MTFGLIIILIALVGYASNWLNWRFLNFGLVRLLYYIGAFVHEASHAVLCLLTGARIVEFKALSSEPRVVHGRPRLPLVGGPLISIAPIFGGMLFLFLANKLVLGGYFSGIGEIAGLDSLVRETLGLISQLDPREWQSWVMALLIINVGAMIGPSPQDLRNMWPALVLLLFVPAPALVSLGFAALSLILAGIAVQTALAAIVGLIRMMATRT